VTGTESTFTAVGSQCRIVVVHCDDPGPLLEEGRVLVEQLEAAWSRFRPTSELRALDDRGGLATPLTAPTYAVMELALAAWVATGGRFDPTVRDAVERAGYDRSFEELDLGAVRVGAASGPAPGCAGVILDPHSRSVTLPTGVRLDLGGIGKGRMADLVHARLLALGAAGACVDLGGDVRVGGEAPQGSTWPIAIDAPFDPGSTIGVLDLVDGAVATSSRLRRRWIGPDGVHAHHIIDPSTGAPSASEIVAATVVAGEAAWAEAYAKAVLVAGVAEGVALVAEADLAAVIVTEGGDVLTAGPADRFLRPTVSA